MVRDGVPIYEHYAKHSVSTGIEFWGGPDGLVPLYEEYAAMLYARHNSITWRTIGWRDRSLAVAHYRLSQFVELHKQDAVSAKVERGKPGDAEDVD